MYGTGIESSWSSGAVGDFPNPFMDAAGTAIPRSFRNALYWCEYIYMTAGTYRSAMERILSYFLTDIEFTSGTDEEQEKYREFYDHTLDFFSQQQSMLRHRMAYGNGFASFTVPFQRFLRCPRKGCGSSWTLKTVYEDQQHFHFEWTASLEFSATCPRCGFRGVFDVVDQRHDLEKKLAIKHWSPHEIDILHDPFTDQVAYLWRIPEDYKSLVRAGNLFHLERVSKPVLKAIRNNSAFRFFDDVIFHMKEPTLAGLRNRGWGFPRTLTNFRQIWYVQALRRINEAIALDYVIPLRIITPEARAGASGASADPLAMFNGGDASAQIRSMIRRRRRDPGAWQTLPFPVKYQIAGGEANQLAPRDLLDQGYEVMLNDAGTPVELYKGSLQLQAAPVALRLFEATWHPLVHDANAFLRWSLRQVSQILGWEQLTANHQRVQIADDIQKSMVAVQLAMAEKMSGTTAFRQIGQDWKKEQRLIAEEAQYTAELQARAQEEMSQAGVAQQIAKGQQAAQGGQPGQGGAPAQGGDPSQAPPPPPVDQYMAQAGDAPTTPEDMMQDADQLAQGLIGKDPSTVRGQLAQLKKYNEVLYSLVKHRMETIRKDASSQGRQMVLQQQFGGQG